MFLTEREIDLPASKEKTSLLTFFREAVSKHLDSDEIPVRFAVTQSNSDGYHCELGVLKETNDLSKLKPGSIFDLTPREIENSDIFNAVMIVPTGIGADIGGHAGDATPVARMMAASCDTLITHPNVVNASDINELPENGLYVEGSVLTQLLMGTVGLQKVRANRVMLIIEKHPDSRISDFAINAASAGRATLGLDCSEVIEMDPTIKMRAEYSTSGRAVGRIEYFERLFEVLHKHKSKYDAVALASIIEVPEKLQMEYFKSHGELTNPWGGAEAMLTHAVSMLFGVPSAHAPMLESIEMLNLRLGKVDPRMAAEAISASFLHCVLKGLHHSPRIIGDRMLFAHPNVITAADVSCLVIPDKCIGLPTLAALEQGIPVIAVRENHNLMKNDLEKLGFAKGKYFVAENYPEAVGIMTALKAGVGLESVHRPLKGTDVVCESFEKLQEERKEIAEFKE